MGKDIEGERGKILAQPGPDKGKRLAYNREGVCNQACSQVRSERRLIKIFKNVEIKGEDVPRQLRTLLGGRKHSQRGRDSDALVCIVIGMVLERPGAARAVENLKSWQDEVTYTRSRCAE